MKKLLYTLSLALSCLAAQACGDYADSDNLVVHEWGTFTSIQGTDGVPISWESLNSGDLPNFVYNRTRAQDAAALGVYNIWAGGKGSMSSVQRMETPVIYFYTLKPKTVDVRVDFPEGTITEWYPQIRKFGPAAGTNVTTFINPQQRTNSYIEWTKVHIQPGTKSDLRKEAVASHYYTARETDAAEITIHPPMVGMPLASLSNVPAPQTEKFLFYRGLGDFSSPLKARATDDSITIENALDMPLTHVFVVDQRQGKYAFSYQSELAGKQSVTIPLSSPTTESREELLQAMRKALTSAGLFEKEASAMVKTWEDSWFDEKGLRVLYVLPVKWVDSTLPLKLNPAPAKLARIFVGRAEMLTPTTEKSLKDLVQVFSVAEAANKPALASAVKKLQLGRFTQAAFTQITHGNPDQTFVNAAWALYQMSLIAQEPVKTLTRAEASLSLSCSGRPSITYLLPNSDKSTTKLNLPRPSEGSGPK